MKIVTLCMTLYLHLFLSVTATDIVVKWPQTYYMSKDRVVTLWGSLCVEDIEILAVYNETRFLTFKQSWSKGYWTDTDWMFFDMFLSSYLYYFQIHIDEISKEIGHTGALTVQCMVICPSATEYPVGYAFKLAINGEDLVHLNVQERLWVAGSYPHAEAVQEKLQSDQVTMISIEKMLKNQCHAMAVTYSTAGKAAFSRQSKPKVYITSKPHESETEVICMVTGFYPKTISVSLWQKDKMEPAMAREILPNGDETYQITVLTVTNITERKSVYCKVEHISSEWPIIVFLDRKKRTFKGLATILVFLAILGAIVSAYVIRYCSCRRCPKCPRRRAPMAVAEMERVSLRQIEGDATNN